GLSFATENLDELDALRRLFNDNDSQKFDVLQTRYVRFQNQSFKNLEYDFDRARTTRQSPFKLRKKAHDARLNLPDLPTTKYRSVWYNSRITDEDYKFIIKYEIARWINILDDIGLYVLVHGDFERNDLVELFGEKLQAFLVTKFCWVQSYGSRAVKPPIIYV